MAQGMRDAYLVLQIHHSAVPEVIEAAYRALAMLHHPDLSTQPDAVNAMAELNAAYATLRNPELRRAYDKTRVAIPVANGGSLSERVQEGVRASTTEHDRPDHATLDFGRYTGMTLGQVVRIDPEYLDWLKRHSAGVRYRHQIDELQSRMAARRAD